MRNRCLKIGWWWPIGILFGMVVTAYAAGGMQALSRAQIEGEIHKAVAAIIPAHVERFEIETRHLPASLDVPTGIVQIRAHMKNPGKYRGYALCEVEIRVNKRPWKRWNAGVKIRTYENVMVAAVDLPRGTALDRAALRTELLETTTLQQPYFQQPDSLAGLRTTRLVKAGAVLTKNMVEMIPLVERGDVVTMVAKRANIVITTLGKALEAGCMHDVIDVKNIDSNKRLKGEIIDVRRVLVRPDLQ